MPEEKSRAKKRIIYFIDKSYYLTLLDFITYLRQLIFRG
jgi:hypothetical protein